MGLLAVATLPCFFGAMLRPQIARADDTDCQACGRKPKCAECERDSVSETAKRCANPVKNFFVHKVSGTIVRGFGFKKCDSCAEVSTTTVEAAPKSDCGCGK